MKRKTNQKNVMAPKPRSLKYYVGVLGKMEPVSILTKNLFLSSNKICTVPIFCHNIEIGENVVTTTAVTTSDNQSEYVVFYC